MLYYNNNRFRTPQKSCSMPPIRPRSLLDRLGAFGSLLCAIHCALLPLLIAMLPSLGVAAWLGGSFEAGFVIFATGLGLVQHALGLPPPSRRACAVAAAARACWCCGWACCTGRCTRALVPHAIAMTLGGTLVGLAHLANLRLNHGHVHDASCAH